MQKKKMKKIPENGSDDIVFWQDPDHRFQGNLHRRMDKKKKKINNY